GGEARGSGPAIVCRPPNPRRLQLGARTRCMGVILSAEGSDCKRKCCANPRVCAISQRLLLFGNKYGTHAWLLGHTFAEDCAGRPRARISCPPPVPDA